MDMNFFDWSYLGSFAGALAAVALITEMVKNVAILKKVPTQIVSWVLAVIVLILAQFFTGALTAESAVLALLNGAMVSLAANGGYAALKRVLEGKTDTEE